MPLRCYWKSYIYEVWLFGSVFTQLYSIIITLCIIALTNCWFFSVWIQGVGWGSSFLKVGTVASTGVPPPRTCTNKGGGPVPKMSILCECNNWMALKTFTRPKDLVIYISIFPIVIIVNKDVKELSSLIFLLLITVQNGHLIIISLLIARKAV